MHNATIRFTDALPPTLHLDGGATDVTKDTTPPLAGSSSAPALSRVMVTVDGQTLVGFVDEQGRWTVTTPAALPAGHHVVVVKVRDPAGNGAVVTQDLLVEINPPAPVLGSAAAFSVLAGSGVVNTGASVLSADLGSHPVGTVVGFPPGLVGGVVHADDSVAAGAQQDLLQALEEVSARGTHTRITQDLGGQIFHAGVHDSVAALSLTGTVTLDGEGDPDSVFVFRTGAAFDTAAVGTVVLVNQADPANVFWVVGGAVGTGASSSLSGSLLARGAITLGAGTVLNGRALSLGAVTLAHGIVTTPSGSPSAGAPRANRAFGTAPPMVGNVVPSAAVRPTRDHEFGAVPTEPATAGAVVPPAVPSSPDPTEPRPTADPTRSSTPLAESDTAMPSGAPDLEPVPPDTWTVPEPGVTELSSATPGDAGPSDPTVTP